jgi:choline dehydrogenase-like flavoprotein
LSWGKNNLIFFFIKTPGVVASQMAQAGKSVLVIEKGGYHHEDDFVNDEATAFENLYDIGGFRPGFKGSISISAGSAFGDATKVNWTACLTLQHFVREEWAKQRLSHFMTPKVGL